MPQGNSARKTANRQEQGGMVLQFPVSHRPQKRSVGHSGAQQTLDRAKTPALELRGIDYSVLIITVLLVAFGLVMVFSASYYRSQLKTNDGFATFIKQASGAGMGLAGLVFFMLFDYRKMRKLIIPALAVSFILCCLVWVPGIGQELNGARRWLNLGISVQPSEVAKVAVILYTAAGMAVKRDRMTSFTRGLLSFLMVNGLFIVLILAQPNMSMAVSFYLVMISMLFIGGAKKWHLGGLLALGGAAGVVLMLGSEYRRLRYTAFLNPWKDPLDTGYQLIQSLYALGNGGLFGVGLGQSRQKYLFLPYSDSDFIFAVIGEEFGWVGAVALLGLFLLLIWRGIRIAITCQDLFGTYLAAGITMNLALQVVINVLVVTGSMPPTGLPLPFISAGGSSLAIFMAEMGMLMNISRRCASA